MGAAIFLSRNKKKKHFLKIGAAAGATYIHTTKTNINYWLEITVQCIIADKKVLHPP